VLSYLCCMLKVPWLCLMALRRRCSQACFTEAAEQCWLLSRTTDWQAGNCVSLSMHDGLKCVFICAGLISAPGWNNRRTKQEPWNLGCVTKREP
jgi:hypothetical protein